MNKKSYTFRWLFKCPFLYSLLGFLLELSLLQIYLIPAFNKNYWMKNIAFPPLAFFAFWFFSIAIAVESILFAKNIYLRHKRKAYSPLRLKPTWRYYVTVLLLIGFLMIHLYLGKIVGFPWKLGLHFLLLISFVAFVYDTNRKRELWLLKLIRKLKTKDAFRVDILSIKYVANEHTGYTLYILILYDVPMILLYLANYDKEIMLASLILDLISIAIFAPLFILGHFCSRYSLLKIETK